MSRASLWNAAVVGLLVVALALVVGWLLTSREDGSSLATSSSVTAQCHRIGTAVAPLRAHDDAAAVAAAGRGLRHLTLPTPEIRTRAARLSRALTSLSAPGAPSLTSGPVLSAVDALRQVCPSLRWPR